MEAALKLIDGDTAFLTTLFGKFLKEHAGDADKLADSVDASDWAVASRTAHTLKSISTSIGANALRNQAERIEHAIRSEQIEDIASLANQVKTTMKKTICKLEQVIKDTAI